MQQVTLEQLVQHPPPSGVRCNLGTIGVDALPVELTSADVDINLVSAEPASTLPGEANEPEHDDDGESETRREETLGSVEAGLANRSSDGRINLEPEMLATCSLSSLSIIRKYNLPGQRGR